MTPVPVPLTYDHSGTRSTMICTVIQGIPNHWEFRVSRRNLLKKILNNLCILLI